ncbi:MAG TPA: class I SAM-dependent methyltransferase [Streptosporangiaceae bacterium]
MSEQELVREFYETYGWQVGSSGSYRDAEHFVDLRPVMRGYYRRRDRRVARQLAAAGGTLLDVGCGGNPIRVPDSGSRRVCIDVTAAALQGARSALGTTSAYIQADASMLPFRSGSITRVHCAHVLYHLPRRRQFRAMAEIHRVLADGGAGFVVYTRQSAPLFRLTERLRARRSSKAIVPDRPELPYTPLDCAELQRVSGEHMDLQLRTWAVLENDVTRVAIPDNILGKAVLLLVSWAESVLPRRLLPLARYPMFVIRKIPPEPARQPR